MTTKKTKKPTKTTKTKTVKKPTKTARASADVREIRKLKKENGELRKALAKACDWALDSADVIEDDGVGVDAEETEDFRDVILSLRKLSGEPEEERHATRRKAREAKTEDADDVVMSSPAESENVDDVGAEAAPENVDETPSPAPVEAEPENVSDSP